MPTLTNGPSGPAQQDREVVDYKSVQFTKTIAVLAAMGVDAGKPEQAKQQLRDNGRRLVVVVKGIVRLLPSATDVLSGGAALQLDLPPSALTQS